MSSRIGIWLLLTCSVMLGCDVDLRVRNHAKSAFEHYSDGHKLKSAQTFGQLAEKYPESNYTGKNLFNAAMIYHEIDSLDLAVKAYKKVLTAQLDDNEKDSSRSVGETRSNYKHYSSRNIGMILIRQGHYGESLQYLRWSKYRFPYQSDSTRSIKRREINVDGMITTCYEKLGMADSALVTILPHALTNSPWSRHSAKERALSLIDEHFQAPDIMARLEQGFDSSNKGPSFVRFPFMNKEIVLVPFECTVDELTPEELRKTAFYLDLYWRVHGQ